MARSKECENCGRSLADAPERRQEGKLWFCTPSCQLTYASRTARAGSTRTSRSTKETKAASSAPRGAVRGTARAIGKTIKWVVILAVLAVIALVVAVIVGVGQAVNKSEKNGALVTPAKYARVKVGMTPTRVRRLLGKPENTSSIDTSGFKTVCWIYGTLSQKTSSTFCFNNGKLATKSRTS